MTSTNSRLALEGALPWGRLATLPAVLAERAAAYRLYRSTLTELSGLSDRDLADIGVPRGLIRDVAAGAASRA